MHASEIVGIAGVEGNGQTELIEAIAGLIRGGRVVGDITIDGRSITRLAPRERRELGVAHVPEDRHRGLLLDFTVADNAILGHTGHRSPPTPAMCCWTIWPFAGGRPTSSPRSTCVRRISTCRPAPCQEAISKLIIGREGGLDGALRPRLLARVAADASQWMLAPSSSFIESS